MGNRLEIESGGGEIVVRGDLDMDSSPELLAAIRAGLTGGDAAIAIRLNEVTYVDSSGIAVLVQGLKLARKEQRDYVLVEPSAPVMSVIELSQLDKFFEIRKSGSTG